MIWGMVVVVECRMLKMHIYKFVIKRGIILPHFFHPQHFERKVAEAKEVTGSGPF